MSKTVWPGAALSAPIPPALVVCGNQEETNILTVAWTGLVNTEPPMTYISVMPKRYSYHLIQESREFTINFPSASMARAVDMCGVYTGSKVSKFERCCLHTAKSSTITCPILEESPVSLECQVVSETDLGSHTMFIAKIVAVDIDDNLIDETGKLHIEKAHLMAFAHGSYFELGRRIGGRGFAVRKKPHRPSSVPHKGDT